MPTIREGALQTRVVDGKEIDRIYLSTTTNKLFEPLESGVLINQKDYTQKISFMLKNAKLFNSSHDNSCSLPLTPAEIKDIDIKLNWVYGIRCTDVLKSFCYYCE